jgi:hypothetical protein
MPGHSQINEVLIETDVDDDEKYLIFEDKKESTRFRRIMKALLSTAAVSIQNTSIGGDFGVFSIENLSAGVILDNKMVEPKHVHHDVDKLYSIYSPIKFEKKKKNNGENKASFADIESPIKRLNQWNFFKFGGKISVPVNYDWGNIAGPIGFYLGGEFGAKREFEFTTLSKDVLEQDDRIIDAILGQLSRAWRSTKKIRLTNNPDKLLSKYHPGTEIRRKQKYLVLGKLGFKYGHEPLTSKVGAFALAEFEGESHFKILGDPDRKLVKFNVRSKRRFGEGGEVSTEFDFKLFSIAFIDAKLNVKVFSGTRERSRGKEIEYEYIYDIEYPEAAEALRKAILGDVTLTQRYAIFRDEIKNYKGIIINKSSNHRFVDVIRRKRWGLSINETYDRLLTSAVKRREMKGSFLYDETIYNRKDTDIVTKDFYKERNHIKDYEHYKEKVMNSFWHFKGRYRSENRVNAYVDTVNKVDPEKGLDTYKRLRLKYDFLVKIKKNSKRLKRRFYPSINNIVRLSKLTDEERQIFNLEDFCFEDHININFKGVFQEEALRRVLEMSDAQLWTELGNFNQITPPESLQYPEVRRKIGKVFNGKNIQKRNIKSFEKNFLKFIRKARQAPNREEAAINFRKLFRQYLNNLFPYEFMLYLNRVDEMALFELPAAFRGVENSMYIESDNCKISWNQADDEIVYINQ